jgi:sarcosine oxidase
MGSSHGHSRIIREAYFEHPLYVPLVRRAYECWGDIEARTGRTIYRKTGGLMLGPAEGPVVAGSRASAVAHGIPHELLSAGEVRVRFPGFEPPEDFVALWEDRAGILYPEVAVEAQLAEASQHGATLTTESEVLDWEANPGHVRVRTRAGSIEAGTLVLSVGPWIRTLLPDLAGLFQVERQLFHWFAPAGNASQWPVALWEHRRGGLFVTLPDGASRLKAGIHHEGEPVDPDTVNRQPTAEDEQRIRGLVARYQPGANGALLDAAVCLYTNTPDGHFVIDRHPRHGNVIIVSPCSGHGFKFSSAVGEVVADLVTTGASRFDLAPFSLRRFAGRIE